MKTPSMVGSARSSLVRRSFEFVRGYRAAISGIVGLALVLAALGAADPLVMKSLFDALSRGDAHILPIAMGTLLVLEIGRGILGAWLSVLTWRVRLSVDAGIRDRVLRKLHALPMEYHATAGVGGTMNQLNQSVTNFMSAFGEIAFNLLPAVLYLVLAVMAMWKMERRLALAVIVFTPLPAVIGIWAAAEQTQRERALLKRWTSIYSRVNEVLAGIRTVKVFTMEQREHDRFLRAQADTNGLVAQGVRTDATTGALRAFAAALARIVAIGFGALLILRGQLTVGGLVAFLGYVTGLFGPVQGLTSIYQTIRKAAVALEAIYGILDADEIVGDLPSAIDVNRVRGDLSFENVVFSHTRDTPLFTGLDLHVRPGETVALVGPSGAGKSTLVSLLLRLHAIESGNVRIDGIDVREMTARSLRQQIGYVGQEIHLFNDSARANIAFGCEGASNEDIEVAARCANAHDFISALPNGYETILGERGSRLSGGQRQRIAIARALLKNAPVLVLDEATSALDNVSEAAVQQALEHLRVGRTTIIIAHRLSTAVNADRIAVVKDGGILAEGTHGELLACCDYYAQLVNASRNGVLMSEPATERLLAVA